MSTPEPTIGRYIAAAFHRLRPVWKQSNLASGVILLVATTLGYSALQEDKDLVRSLSVGLVMSFAFMLFVVAPWQMWRDAQNQIRAHEDRLRPHLIFVHRNERPYVEEFRLLGIPGRMDRILQVCRVGLRNDSSAIIDNVRVTLESSSLVLNGKEVQQTARSPVTLGRALNISGIGSPDGAFSLHPGDTPAAFVDVAERSVVSEKQFREQDTDANWFSLCYASKARPKMAVHGVWTIGLRADGGGTSARTKLTISFDEPNDVLVMRAHATD